MDVNYYGFWDKPRFILSEREPGTWQKWEWIQGVRRGFYEGVEE